MIIKEKNKLYSSILTDFMEKNYKSLIFLIFGIYLIQSIIYILYLNSWLDEGNYLMKSYWYVTGRVKPYSAEDSTWYMPIYFYLLGFWQVIFGIGHYSGRILSSILGVLNMIMVIFIGKKIFNKKWKILLPLLFFVITPGAIKYFNTATPYALVTFVSLILFYIIIQQEKWNWIVYSLVIGILFFLFYFIRPNMIIGIILFCIFMIGATKNYRFFKILISISVFLGMSIVFVQLFPEKMKYYSLILHFFKMALNAVGIFHDPYFLVYKNSVSSIITPFTMDKLSVSLEAFQKAYLEIYLLVIVFSLIGLLFCIKRKHFFSYFSFCSFYFIFLSLGHFISSQTFCKWCIQAYVNYFYLFGCIGAAYGFIQILDKFNIHFKLRNIFLTVIITLIFIFSGYFTLKISTGLLSNPEYSYINQVKDVSKEITKIIPKNEKILVIDGLDITSQAVYYSGRQIEITTINLHHSYRALKTGLTKKEKLDTIMQIKESSLWCGEIMEEWISKQYNYILTGPGCFYNRFLPLIKKYFVLIKEIELQNQQVFHIYKRKRY